MRKRIICLVTVLLLLFSLAGCGKEPDTSADFFALYQEAAGWGFQQSQDEFTALLLGETGKLEDKGNKDLTAFEIYKKYHPEYEGDEDDWVYDLLNGRLTESGEELTEWQRIIDNTLHELRKPKANVEVFIGVSEKIFDSPSGISMLGDGWFWVRFDRNVLELETSRWKYTIEDGAFYGDDWRGKEMLGPHRKVKHCMTVFLSMLRMSMASSKKQC